MHCVILERKQKKLSSLVDQTWKPLTELRIQIAPVFDIEIHKAVDGRVGSNLRDDWDNRILNTPSFEAPKQRLMERYIQMV